jgi:pentatricopeptide repeat protein
MKTYLNHPFKASILILTIILIISCNGNIKHQSQEKESNEIAHLIDRNEKIQHGKEWDQVQNNYVSFRGKIQQDANDADAKIKLALVFIQEARVTGEHGHYYQAALNILDNALRQEKKLTTDQLFLALSTKAGVELSLHQFDKALSTAMEAIKLNTYNAQIYGVLVDAYVELGQYDKAVAMADKMVSIRPDLRSYARVSYLRQIHGDVNGAIEAMKLAVGAGYPPYEETAWARYQLGKLYESHDKYDEANREYLQILLDRPEYPFAIAALGDLAKRNGDYVQAEKLYDEAISIIPEVSFYLDKAEVMFATKRSDQATVLIEEIFSMLADDETSGHKMDLEYSRIYLEILHDQQKALKYALIEYQKRPLNIDVNKQLAAVYLKMDDYEKAKKYLQVAKRTNSHDQMIKELETQLSEIS